MFKKILIAEDHESANLSLQTTLKGLGVPWVKYAYHCDDALLQLKSGIFSKEPYELLITDLSFEEDDRPQRLTSGTALIVAAREIQPGLKVLVFSAEQREQVVAELFHELTIDGYVRKARRDAEQLKAALAEIFKNKKHFPTEFRESIRKKNAHDFTRYDVMVITQLAGGRLLKDIPAYLQAAGVKPSGLSSMEKRLNLIKDALGFTKNEQLVAYCKDKGVI